MSDIAIPPSLFHADAALGLIDIFQKILEPAERKKIAEDIVKFHSLNETEFQKADEARKSIKTNSEFLESIRKESEVLEEKKKEFEQKSRIEREFIEKEHKKIDTNAALAKEANVSVLKLQEDISAREKKLADEKKRHEENVMALKEKEISLDKKSKEMEEYKKSLDDLSAKTKEKVEKLKQFNF